MPAHKLSNGAELAELHHVEGQPTCVHFVSPILSGGIGGNAKLAAIRVAGLGLVGFMARRRRSDSAQ